MEEAIASRDLENMEAKSSVVPSEVLSSEDLAWADSCLVDDLEPSKGWDSWSSLNSALDGVSNFRRDTSPPPRLRAVTFSIGDLSTSVTPEERVDDISRANEETEEYRAFHRVRSEESDYLNVFLPTYREDARDDERNNDYGSLSSMDHWEEESESREEIFKVWNLEIPAEEEEDDEFVKELNKAFSESPTKLTPPKGLGKDSIDDVVSAMADLSLENHVDL